MADDDKKNPAPQKPIAERKEKPKKEDKKVEQDTQKEVITTNKNLDALVSANVSSAARAEKKADALVKSSEAQKEIDKLNAAGRTKEAEKFQKALDESVKLLKGSRTDKTIENRLAELTSINDQANKISESLKKTIDNDPSVSGIERLTQKIEDQTSTIKSDTTAVETGKRLDKLGGMFGAFSNSQTQELQDSFNQAQADLKDAIESGDTVGEDLARAQLEAISKGAESEENRREAQKLNEEANSRLLQIANGMENMGDKLDSGISGAAKGIGFIAALTGLALLFVDPEKFNEIMSTAINKIGAVINYFSALFNGESQEAAYLFEQNAGFFNSLIGGILLLFSGKIIKFLGTALKAARAFRVFMIGTFIPTIVGALTTLGTSMGFAVGGLGVVLAPALLIVALIGGLYLGFKKLQDSLGPGASIMDTLKVAFLYFVDFLAMLVNGITFIPRKIIGMLGPRLAKWLMGDDFDTSMIDSLAAGLDTGRGARAAEEIRKKNEEQAAYNEARDSGMSKEEAQLASMEGMSEEDLMAAIEKKTTIDGAQISQSSADLQADQATTASNISVSTVTSTPTTTNNQVIQSSVTHMLPSAAKSVLGGASSR